MSLLHPRSAPSGRARPGVARIVWDSRDETAAAPIRPAGRADARDAGFAIDRLDAVDAAAHRDAWVDLVGRALEPNVFLDPDFALPAAQHLAGPRRPCFVLVWTIDAGGERRDLVAVCTIVVRRGARRGLASAWMHDLSTLGFPVLDRDRAAPALRALLAWAGETLRGASGLLIPSLPADGPTAAVLHAVAAAGGLDVAVLDGWERAALVSSVGAGLAALSPKGAKELRRQRRRLAERGTLAYGTAATDDAVLRAEVERFLALEAAGWKGAAGTALLSWPGRTAFLRTATRMLVRRGLCRIDRLTLGGEPVAMAVILTAGAQDFLWKIAYREDVSRASPGVQLVLEITEAQRRKGGGGIDSCAVPDHPMIDRLWRDRLRFCDVAVAIRPGHTGAFRRALRVERAARRLRASAKRLVLLWRARRAANA